MEGCRLSRLINKTKSLCKICKRIIPADVVTSTNNEVWMNKECEVHGIQKVKFSNNAKWYESTRKIIPPINPSRLSKKEVQYGCPLDCGTARAALRLSCTCTPTWGRQTPESGRFPWPV